MEGYPSFAPFRGCITLASRLIARVGALRAPAGPCVVPAWPGIQPPSGVVATGAALVLRGLVQRRLGLAWAVAAIAVGAVPSGLVSPAALVLASAAAFVLSELADLAVYTPSQRRGLAIAVVASEVVGLAAGSVLLLSLALGSLDALEDQATGRASALRLALPAVQGLRQRDRRLGIGPARGGDRAPRPDGHAPPRRARQRDPGGARPRPDERPERVAEAGPGAFVSGPPFVPHPVIDAGLERALDGVPGRSEDRTVVADIDAIDPVGPPEEVHRVDPVHGRSSGRSGTGSRRAVRRIERATRWR